ncbi:MAG: hypothetical protein Q9191_005318 [Dirinaria sp. TL-2023a]
MDGPLIMLILFGEGGGEDIEAREIGEQEKEKRDIYTQRRSLIVYSRVTALLDAATPFLELSSLAGHEVYPGEDVPAGGIITGIGSVHGISCMIVANDSTYSSVTL